MYNGKVFLDLRRDCPLVDEGTAFNLKSFEEYLRVDARLGKGLEDKADEQTIPPHMHQMRHLLAMLRVTYPDKAGDDILQTDMWIMFMELL